jgi:membrane-bound lytic murein transglycosylase D
MARQLESVLPLMDYVSREVAQKQLPAEFVLIPLIESGYRPGAVGAGQPLGLWQMIASTARNHGVVIRAGYDGRLSPVESTRAALSYLDTLHAMMGPWPATVMAYNAGENRVRAALKRSPAGDPAAGLRHPQGLDSVTYEYVAKLQALSCLIADPGQQGIELPMQARFERLREVNLDPDLDSIDELANRLGISGKALRELNPAYRGGHVAKDVPRAILVPASAAAGGMLSETAAP